MAAAGMRGLEVDYPDHLPEQVTSTERWRISSGSWRPAARTATGRGTPVRLGTSLCRPEAFDELRAAVRQRGAWPPIGKVAAGVA